MSIWKDNFESQQLGSKLAASLSTWESATVEGLSGKQVASYARLIKVLKLLIHRLSHIDPEVFPSNVWSGTSTALQNIQNHGAQFNSTRNASLLQAANDQIDQLLKIFGHPPTPDLPHQLTAIEETSEVLQRKLGEILDELKEKHVTLRADIKSLTASVAEGKRKLIENDRTIEQQKARLDEAVSQFQKQFSEAESIRAQDVRAVLQKANEALNAAIEKHGEKVEESIAFDTAQFEQFLENTNRRAEEALAELAQKEADAKSILNVIGNVAVTSDYKSTAEREGKAANVLRGIALALMLSMSTIAAITFYHSLTHSEIDWHLFAFRIATTLVLAIPALYAAQESSKHRMRERLNRKVHLELSAIDAYLALLPDSQKQDLKAKLTEKFFGVPEVSGKDEPVTNHELFDLLGRVLQNVTKNK